jgi:hypothetical protein
MQFSQQSVCLLFVRFCVLGLIALTPNLAHAMSLKYDSYKGRENNVIYSYATPARFFDNQPQITAHFPDKNGKDFFRFDEDFWRFRDGDQNDKKGRQNIACLMCGAAHFKSHFIWHKGWHRYHHCNKPDIDNVPLPPSLVAFSLGLVGLWFVSKRQKLA